MADYCLHDPRMPGEAHHPESAERVEWTETRNLATSEGERAARIMAATAEASPELKRLAGVAATGRKLEKPVCHYSLSWAKDEKPDRQEMSRAAAESLKALGMERNQALIVSHRDGQPHVHVIANRVDPESGQAAGLNRSKREWSALYGRHQRQREQLSKDCRGVLGRFRAWRELGGGVREIGGAIRGRTEVLGRFRAELENRLRWELVSLGKEHSEAVRGIESKGGRILPRWPGRVGETGAGGGAVGRALTGFLPSS